jgi:hypothetical protein
VPSERRVAAVEVRPQATRSSAEPLRESSNKPAKRVINPALSSGFELGVNGSV